MSNVVIPYSEIIDLIDRQFSIIKRSNIKVFVEDEQMWNKESQRDPEAIYIVVHFGESTINFGVAVCNITLEVMSLQNEVEITQNFLNEYVNTYNRASDDKITQLYLSPARSLNFNQVYEGYRSLFTITGTFLISNSTVSLTTLTYYYNNKSEDIDIIAYNEIVENSLNPQPYPNMNGRTKSYASFQTFAFTIVTYPDSNKQLIKDLWTMKFGETRSHQNDEFEFSGTFNNNMTAMPKWKFKCRSCEFSQRIGEMPILTLAFSR